MFYVKHSEKASVIFKKVVAFGLAQASLDDLVIRGHFSLAQLSLII